MLSLGNSSLWSHQLVISRVSGSCPVEKMILYG